jgi:hypothetical protein
MVDDRLFDNRITELLRHTDRNIPAEHEIKIRTAASSVRRRPRLSFIRRPFFLVLAPAAAAVLLLVFLLLPALRKPPAPQISEIRTEFELADKNIKIIFYQKSDFSLFKED